MLDHKVGKLYNEVRKVAEFFPNSSKEGYQSRENYIEGIITGQKPGKVCSYNPISYFGTQMYDFLHLGQYISMVKHRILQQSLKRSR